MTAFGMNEWLRAPLAFGSIGTPELIIIGVVVLLLFGTRLPSVMRSLGRGIVEFKKGAAGIEDDQDQPNGKIEDKKPREGSA